MTQIPPLPRRRAFGCGVASAAVAVAGILPTAIVFVLAGTADPNYGWLVFLTLPLAVLFGGIALVLGVIGLVFARADGGAYAWPVVGAVLGVVAVLPSAGFLWGG